MDTVSEPANSGANVWLSRYRRLALGTVGLAAFVSGLSDHNMLLRALGALVFASALTLWCTLDGEVHSKRFLHSFGWQLMWTWPLGLIVYLTWTRRLRGLVTYVVMAVAGFALAGAGMGVSTLLR